MHWVRPSCRSRLSPHVAALVRWAPGRMIGTTAMAAVSCLRCGHGFTPRATGGRRQKFCSPICRTDFFGACRDWAASEVEAGRLLVSTIRAGRKERARCSEGDQALGRYPGPLQRKRTQRAADGSG